MLSKEPFNSSSMGRSCGFWTRFPQWLIQHGRGAEPWGSPTSSGPLVRNGWAIPNLTNMASRKIIYHIMPELVPWVLIIEFCLTIQTCRWHRRSAFLRFTWWWMGLSKGQWDLVSYLLRFRYGAGWDFSSASSSVFELYADMRSELGVSSVKPSAMQPLWASTSKLLRALSRIRYATIERL